MSHSISHPPLDLDNEVTAVRAGGAAEPQSKPALSETPTLVSGPGTVPAVPATHGANLGMAGPYHLAIEIAHGGMAVVYLAIQDLRQFENAVAVKRIHQHLSREPNFIDMFADEAKIAASINHPYVCRVFDFGKSEGNYYLAMEYLRGEPLSQVFRALTPERLASPRHAAIVARIIANLAEGLHAAHSLKDNDGVPLEVVHRDVSPQNLFVLCDGTVRVTDFGVARARARRHHTQNSGIKGKIMFMAPEQLERQMVDRRTDVWSLGVVAWKFLTGRSLFKARGEGGTVLAILKQPITAPSRLNPAIPKELDAILLRALARNPADRYPDARAFARDLEHFIRGSATNLDVAEWLELTMPGVAAKHQQLVQRAHESIRAQQRALPGPAARTPARSQFGQPSQLKVALTLGFFLFGISDFAYFEQRHARAATQVRAGRAQVMPLEPSAARALPSQSAAPRALTASAFPAPPAPSEAPKHHPLAHFSPAHPQPNAVVETGAIQLETKGGRAEVLLGDSVLGTTPLTLELPPGSHTLELKPLSGGELRTVSLNVIAGTDELVSVPLPSPPAPADSGNP